MFGATPHAKQGQNVELCDRLGLFPPPVSLTFSETDAPEAVKIVTNFSSNDTPAAATDCGNLACLAFGYSRVKRV